MIDDDPVGPGGCNGQVAPDPHGFLRIPAEELRCIGDFAARIAEGLAVLQ